MILRLFKFIVSLAVFFCDWLRRKLGRTFGRIQPGTCVFINYHSIDAGTRAAFARQMGMLNGIARSIDQIKSRPLEPNSHCVVVTFDDAFCSFADHALPVLRSLGVPVVLFAPSGYLGRKSAWVDYGGENPVGEEVLSRERLLAISRAGGVEIGSHCALHKNLVELTEEEVRAELRDSKETLEALLGRKIDSLSFPYGSFGGRELMLAAQEGYKFCFGVTPQTVVGQIQEGLIGRVSVQPSDWPWEFRLKTSGAYRWLPPVGAWKRRIGRMGSVSTDENKAQAYG